MYSTIIKSTATKDSVRRLSRRARSDKGKFTDPIEEMDSVIAEGGYMWKLWSEVKEQIQQMVDSAKDGGFKEGKNAGFSELKDQVKDEMNEFNEMVLAFKEDTLSFFEETEKFVLRMSIKIAEKILQKKFVEEDDFTLTIVQNALKTVRDSINLFIRVNPDDYEFIKSMDSQLSSESSNVKISGDEEIERGGCKIESDWGLVDARIDTQLEKIYSELVNPKNKEPASIDDSDTG